jgi:predicted RNA binding protein YcfA (HicA-like mRNA interferase family)
MSKQLSSKEVAWLLQQFGITFKRHGKEDIFEGFNTGKLRTVIVLRNKKSISEGTLVSILRQTGISRKEAEEVFKRK